MFGISSDEYLNYAMQNRDEWAEKGQAVVDSMRRKIMMDLTRKTLSRELLSMHTRHSDMSRRSRLSGQSRAYDSDDDLSDVNEFSEEEAVEITVDGSPVDVKGPKENKTAVSSIIDPSAQLEPGQKLVLAPPGPLGVLIDPTPEGPVVEEVKIGSSLSGKVQPQDMLISIDGVNVRYLSAEAIMAMIRATSMHTRKLVFQSY